MNAAWATLRAAIRVTLPDDAWVGEWCDWVDDEGYSFRQLTACRPIPGTDRIAYSTHRVYSKDEVESVAPEGLAKLAVIWGAQLGMVIEEVIDRERVPA